MGCAFDLELAIAKYNTNIKQTAGTKYANCILLASETLPITTGKIAPPTIDITK